MIDWRAQFEFLEEQIEHMLVMVARRFEEHEKEIELLSRDAEVRLIGFEVTPLKDEDGYASLVCLANGPDLEYALTGGERSLGSDAFQRSNTFKVSNYELLSGEVRAIARNRSNPAQSDMKTLEN